jgi:2-dehydro-3-deoxygluconokinase
MSLDIVAIGEPMVEFNQTGADGGRSYLQGFGGDSSNFAIAAARQGAKAGYLTSLGADVYGRMFRDLWRTEGVDAHHVREDADAFTAVYFVTHDAGGHHFSFFRKGSAASRFGRRDLPETYLATARYVHLSGISLAISDTACDAGFAAIAAARRGGAKITFDTNLRLKLWPIDRARAVTSEAIAQCDVCLPSLEDVVTLYGTSEPNRILDRILAMGPKIVVLKMGDKGCMVADTMTRTLVRPHPCRPVDATGAGDTFGGAFVARLAAGDDPIAAARYANVAAALSTQGYGAVAPIPRAAEVRAALAANAA